MLCINIAICTVDYIFTHFASQQPNYLQIENLPWIVYFNLLNIFALIILRFIMLLLQLIIRSFWSIVFYGAYVGFSIVSGTFSFIYGMNFSIISPAFKLIEFNIRMIDFKIGYLIFAYVLILTFTAILLRTIKRRDIQI